jgi:flagellar protein FlaG
MNSIGTLGKQSADIGRGMAAASAEASIVVPEPGSAPAQQAAAATSSDEAASRASSETARISQRAELSRAAAEELAAHLSEQFKVANYSLSFTVNEEIGQTVVRVIDPKTEEVIRQIPSEELVRIAEVLEQLQEQLGSNAESVQSTGILIQEQA